MGMKGVSKFDYENFYGGYDDLAVSKQKYTKAEAVEIAKFELKHRKHKYLAIGNGFARHRAGINEDNEPCVGWWLEYSKHKTSCPCWIFHTTNDASEHFSKDYDYIALESEE